MVYIRSPDAWILNVLYNKDPESDKGVNAKRSEKQSSQLLEFLPLPMLRPKGQSCLYKSSDHMLSQWNLRLPPQLLSPPTLNSSLCPAISLPVSTSLVLGLKVWANTPWLCFSLRLIQSCVAQGGLELRDLPASVFQMLGLKMCATTAWPLRLTRVASSALWSLGKFSMLDHRQNITLCPWENSSCLGLCRFTWFLRE